MEPILDTDKGERLAALWGDHAPPRFGVIIRRMGRIMSALVDEDQVALWTFYHEQPQHLRERILCTLAGR